MSIEGLSDVYDGVAEAVENMVSAEAVKGPMQAIDMRPALVIVAIVAVSSLVLELLCWMFVYRTQDYRRIVRDIEEHHRQFAKLKHAATNDKDLPRKRKKLDEAMVKTAQEFAGTVRMRTGVLTAGLMFLVYRFVSNQWPGIVVARLPFFPPAFLQRMTHNGLAGDDMLDCSALFVYVLCGLAVRTNVAKYLNLGPSRAVSAIMSPQNVMDKAKYD